MSLYILLGYSGSYREGTPDLLYIGLDRTVSEKTRKASPHPRFLELRDPTGHRRENPTPGVVDIDTLRTLQSEEEKEIIALTESNLQAAFERGGNAAAKHYAEQIVTLEARIKELTEALAVSDGRRIELTDALAAAEALIANPPASAPVVTQPETTPLALDADSAAPGPEAPPAGAPDAAPPKGHVKKNK